MTTHPNTPTDEMERLAEQITPGPWSRNAENAFCNQIDGERDAICTDQFCYSPKDQQDANARAIALVPDLLRKSIEDDATIKAMRALLLAGCDLLAIESECLREGISIGGVMSPGPEDAHTVEAIREIEGWIASATATLTAGDSHDD